jgi:hypothetical protein
MYIISRSSRHDHVSSFPFDSYDHRRNTIERRFVSNLQGEQAVLNKSVIGSGKSRHRSKEAAKERAPQGRPWLRKSTEYGTPQYGVQRRGLIVSFRSAPDQSGMRCRIPQQTESKQIQREREGRLGCPFFEPLQPRSELTTPSLHSLTPSTPPRSDRI